MRRSAARLSLLLVLLAAAVGGAVGRGRPADASALSRPNVVVIMTDDQRFDSLGNCLPYYGAPDGADSVPCMPNVRSMLQAHGVTFDQSFVTTSVCCPSRASFLTGRYAHNHRVFTNEKPDGGYERFRPEQASTLATWLHGAGYRTGLVGKYLNGYDGPETPPGWDDWHAMFGSASANYRHFKLVENGVVNSYSKTYHTTVLGQKAVDFIDSTPADQPLFLYFAPHAPHFPFTPASGDGSAYRTQPPWRPPSYAEQDVSDKPPFWRSLPVPDSDTEARHDAGQVRQLETLIEVDRQIGNIVAALGPRIGNTLFVFTSDNGLTWGEHRSFEHKGCEFEECARVPLVVRYDPLIGGAPSEDPTNPVLNVDLAPTIVEAAGATGAGPMDGRSLLSLLAGSPPSNWRTAILGENFGSLSPVRQAWPPSNSFIETFAGDPAGTRAKYVVSCDRDAGVEPCPVTATSFYDEGADPYELCNLLPPDGCGPAPPPTLVQRLAARLRALRAARPPVTSVDPPPATSTTPVTVTFGGIGLSRFRCAVDGGPPESCSSPFTPPAQGHGPHALIVLGDGRGGTAAPVVLRWWISDRIPATPQFTSAPASPSGRTVSFSFTDSELGVSFRCSLDDADATPCVSPVTASGLGAGGHVFEVSALDAGDNLSFPAVHRWRVAQDTTPPTILMKLPADDSFRSSRAVTARWAGADQGSGIARYDLVERDGIGARPRMVQSGRATSFTVSGAASGTYCFRVAAFDHEGNRARGPQRCTAVPLDDRDLSFTGPLARLDVSGAYGGTVTEMAGPGSAAFTFTGRRTGVLFRKGPRLGKVSVRVDGGAAHVVDLYSSTPRALWWTRAFGSVSRHRVTVAWTGRRNSSSTGSRVALDAVAAIAEAAPVPA